MFNVCTITEIPWQRNAIHFQSHEEPCLLKEKKRKLHQEINKQKILQGKKYIKKKFLKQKELPYASKQK